MTEKRIEEERKEEILRSGFVVILRDCEEKFLLRQSLGKEVGEILQPFSPARAMLFTVNHLKTSYVYEEDRAFPVSASYETKDERTVVHVGYQKAKRYHHAFTVEVEDEEGRILETGTDITDLSQLRSLYDAVKEEKTPEVQILVKFIRKWTYYFHLVSGREVNQSLIAYFKGQGWPGLQKGVSVAPMEDREKVRKLKEVLWEAQERTEKLLEETPRLREFLSELKIYTRQSPFVVYYYATTEEEIESTRQMILEKSRTLVSSLEVLLSTLRDALTEGDDLLIVRGVKNLLSSSPYAEAKNVLALLKKTDPEAARAVSRVLREIDQTVSGARKFLKFLSRRRKVLSSEKPEPEELSSLLSLYESLPPSVKNPQHLSPVMEKVLTTPYGPMEIKSVAEVLRDHGHEAVALKLEKKLSIPVARVRF